MKLLLSATALLAATLALRGATVSPAFEQEVVRAFAGADGESFVCSPYAAALAMGLLGDGLDAREARVALRARMGTGANDFGSAFAAENARQEEWAASNGVRVAVAVSLWLRNYRRADPEFHLAAARRFGAVFGPLADAAPVNAWTAARTRGIVEDAIESLDPGCNGALVSAAGFDGAWETPFPAAADAVFHAPGGDVQVKTLSGVRAVRTLRRPGYTALALPYRGAKLHLYAFLPDAGLSPADLAAKLTPEEMDLADRALLPGYAPVDDYGTPLPPVEGAEAKTLRLSIPRFRIDTARAFGPVLEAVGLPAAGYESICPGLSIGQAAHRAVFAVTETGDDPAPPPAAAAPADAAPALALDRPFLFAVRTVNRLTLVAGRYTGR